MGWKELQKDVSSNMAVALTLEVQHLIINDHQTCPPPHTPMGPFILLRS